MSGIQTQGRRLPDGPLVEMQFAPGDYMKTDGGIWFCKAPRGSMGNLTAHKIVEHDDGTITVSPSILITDHRPGHSWHGYLERGVWREC